MKNLVKALYDGSDTRELEEVFNLARKGPAPEGEKET
jgi:hypothetical protein